ncbi:hypothetical protein FJZ31_06345 [Candidatus Poribacteria bacterium]|nr:hypothetical protein [Candidatus Poribacteria bacterium]
MRPFSSLRYLEINEERVKQRVYEAFTERFGEGFVKKIFIGKYPSSYEVVVYLENEKSLTDILQLSHSLSDDFEAQGLPIVISTRKTS